MGDDTTLELQVMGKEYEWVLKEELKIVAADLEAVLNQACKSFKNGSEQGSRVKPEKFLLTCASGTGVHSKCMVTLVGDLISEADLGLRLQRQPMIIYQTRIYPEVPYRLQQIQDAGNHLQLALSAVLNYDMILSQTPSGRQVLAFLEDVINHLKLGRESLTLPKIHSITEIVQNPNSKALKPLLPQDTAVRFYVQAQKLILAVYHVHTNPQNRVVDITSRYQLESSVPWLNDALLLFTIALHKCQLLRDKVAMFIHYDLTTKLDDENHSHLQFEMDNSSLSADDKMTRRVGQTDISLQTNKKNAMNGEKKIVGSKTIPVNGSEVTYL